MKNKKRDTLNYNLKQGKKIVYKGTTNDLERRKQEHKSEGKKFTTIQKVGRLKTEKNAKQEETRQLASYRKNNRGQNPKYNKAKNG